MILKTIAAAALALSTLGALPAAAAAGVPGVEHVHGRGAPHDWHGPERHRSGGPMRHWQRAELSPIQIRWALRQQGFRDIRGISRRGPVYVAWARSFRGGAVRLVVGARSGSVLSIQRLRG